MKTKCSLKHAALCMFLLLMTLPGTLMGQHLKVKLGGGFASQYGEARIVGAYKIGLGYEYELDQRWTITPALLFYGKGWKNPDTLVPVTDDNGLPVLDENGEQAYSLMNRSTSANYIEIPILFNYYHRLGASRYLVFGAGPYAAYGITGKVKTKGDGGRYGSEKLFYEGNTFGEDGARRFDAGIQAFAGYQFPSGLTLGIEGDFGLLKFRNGGKGNISALVSLSYTFGWQQH